MEHVGSYLGFDEDSSVNVDAMRSCDQQEHFGGLLKKELPLYSCEAAKH